MPTDISNFPWAERNIIENRRIHIADTLGLQRKKRSRNIHRYEFELVTRDMDPSSEGRSVKAKISNAVNDSITYVDPIYSYTRGSEPVSGIFTNNNISKGQQDLAFTSSGVWQLLAGDYLRFNNDTKVYEIVNDTNLQSGVQVVRLAHPIRKDVSVNTRVTVNNVEWLLSSDGVIEFETDANDNQDIQIVLNAVEQL